jgi:hypothetical protein
VLDEGRPGRGVDVEPEDVRAVVVASWVHVTAPGQDGPQIEVGENGLFFLTYRPGEDAAVGRDDRGVAFLQPGTVFLQVTRRDQPVAVREGGWDLVGVQHRVDADDEHPVLAGQMLQGGNPAVAGRQRGRNPKLHTLGVHVEPGQRHVVFPADQPPNAAERRVHHAQHGPVPHAPHRPLRPGGDELSVTAGQGAVGGQVQQGVVDGAAVLLTFLHPDDQPDPVVAGNGAQPLGGRARHDDGVFGQ